MNFLTLNLADEVARGVVDVDEARRRYTEKAMAFMMGKPDLYTQGFLFEVPKGGTADPDEQTIPSA